MGLKDTFRRLLNKKPSKSPTICAVCGMEHSEWPAIAFQAPLAYTEFSDAQRGEKVKEKNDDFCVIEYPKQTDRFIRAVMLQEVKDYCEPLNYGVWVSLSEQSFEDYNDHFFDDAYEATYFGYLSNHIPPYKDALGTHCNVVYTGGNQRPLVIPHESQREEKSFVDAYYSGISIDEAHSRIALVKR